jgi:hypothetical protein
MMNMINHKDEIDNIMSRVMGMGLKTKEVETPVKPEPEPPLTGESPQKRVVRKTKKVPKQEPIDDEDDEEMVLKIRLPRGRSRATAQSTTKEAPNVEAGKPKRKGRPASEASKQALKRAQELRKGGMANGEALKKAWAEVKEQSKGNE